MCIWHARRTELLLLELVKNILWRSPSVLEMGSSDRLGLGSDGPVRFGCGEVGISVQPASRHASIVELAVDDEVQQAAWDCTQPTKRRTESHQHKCGVLAPHDCRGLCAWWPRRTPSMHDVRSPRSRCSGTLKAATVKDARAVCLRRRQC